MTRFTSGPAMAMTISAPGPGASCSRRADPPKTKSRISSTGTPKRAAHQRVPQLVDQDRSEEQGGHEGRQATRTTTGSCQFAARRADHGQLDGHQDEDEDPARVQPDLDAQQAPDADHAGPHEALAAGRPASSEPAWRRASHHTTAPMRTEPPTRTPAVSSQKGVG